MRSIFPSFTVVFKPLKDIYTTVAEDGSFNPTYFLLLNFAALISLAGLLTNSTPVIIGAMLISPLMGPILCSGLALTLADVSLAIKSGKNLSLSIVVSILLAVIATWFSPLKDATPEILARVNPNLMDLLIAVFSGLAGTLALTSGKPGSTIIPGVAIATAVMPPLATVGYGLSTRQWSIASGAFMLFATNLVSIIISSSVVFMFVGFRPRQELDTEKHHVLVRYRMIGALAVLLLISIPLFRTLIRAGQQSQLRSTIESTFKATIDPTDNAELPTFDFTLDHDLITVNAVLRTHRVIPPSKVHTLEMMLQENLHQKVHLKLQQVEFAKYYSDHKVPTHTNDFVAGGVIHPTNPELLSASTSVGLAQQEVQQRLQSLVEPVGITEITVTSMGIQSDKTQLVQFTGKASELTRPEIWTMAAAALSVQLNIPAHLSGTITVSPDTLNKIVFLNQSSQLTGDALAVFRKNLKPFLGQNNLSVTVVVSPDIHSLLKTARITWLIKELSILKSSINLLNDPMMPGNTVQIRLVQAIKQDSDVPPSIDSKTIDTKVPLL